MSNGFLPISKQDMIDEGIEQLDFVYVCGDAYVDHPSFGHAIIARLLQAHGYTVGIISQPDWKDDESISILGVPRLGFLVSAGNMDSMVNHYSVSKKRRAKDSFTPGGVMGKRPDYATVVYCNLIRHTYKKIPIIIGGIEASLRRMAHYDYWSNKVKRSILLDSGADLISYGMGERSIIEIADALDSGMDVKDITFIDGTVFKTKDRDIIYDAIELPDYDVIKEDKREFARSFYIQYCNTDPFCAKRLVEPYMPEQVQDFYPTPSTISTCMYYTGLDPATLKPVYVTTNPHEKAMQRALIQYRNPKNYDLVHEALVKAGREDLIGFDKKCLIKPRKMHTDGSWDKKTSKSDKNSNSSYGSGKNAGVRKNLKNATERGKNGSGSNTAGTAHKKKTIRNVHKKKR